ncbi:hypothetical protein [Bradyrhizobium sp. JYMT SZCCT0428]|uniref:hypothetical protein n=1 Tax=Bradyrhizobium sp. JYMT SZCCT0428 TaxID=2807673 RepID=UPI001BAB178C|nr:hypothetical protein [Bradyrhizobium sp. JYMT SZCCT0428]MBR1157198.1 hypothetical protein [Bradyrhizobium sp. JYMT SZCCT0428]
MTIASTTILGELLAAMHRQEAAHALEQQADDDVVAQDDVVKRALAARVRELRADAAKMFAERNGWRGGPDIKPFSRSAISDPPTRPVGWLTWADMRPPWQVPWDHCLYLRSATREKGKQAAPAAIVVQPYAPNQISVPDGMRLHVPPHAEASIWFPGRASFFVFTRAGHAEVNWLPEQIVGISQ